MSLKQCSNFFLVSSFVLLLAQLDLSNCFSSPRRNAVASPASKHSKRNRKNSPFPSSSRTKQQLAPNNNNKKKAKKKASKSKLPSKSAPTSTNNNTPAASVGEAIQRAKSVEDLLETASQLWLPTDPDLAPHLMAQQIHHEKRQRWSSQILQKMGCIVSYPQLDSSSSLSSIDNIWNDDRLARAIMASALPFREDITLDRPEKEGRYICQALEGLHALAGSTPKSASQATLHLSIPNAINLLLERLTAMIPKLSLLTLCPLELIGTLYVRM
mmetsp:Transcript_10056/g.15503  ORF Transcript_10056/g.15503 Transcript_10056/m.15503 type:complete len:271 (+) Transcript_10056:92-904(+)